MNVWNFFWSTSSDVDKGWAWIVLLTTFITYGFGWGFISSIGIFYSIWIDEFNASKATIAWITSLPVFFLYLTTPIVVSLRKYTKSYQVLGFVGITLCSSSLVLSTYVNNHYWLFLTYSLLIGIGFSLSQTPPLLLLNKYFIKHLSLANGVTLTGTSVFALVLPILYARTIEGDGWRTSFRVTGVISFVICGSCTLLWRAQTSLSAENKNNKETTRKEPKKDQSYIVLLKDHTFLKLLVSNMFLGATFCIPTTHIVQYAVERNIPRSTASNIPAYFAAGLAVGKLLFGKMFDLQCINKLYLYESLFIASGLVIFTTGYSKNLWQLILGIVFYGIGFGGAMAQIATIMVVVLGREKLSDCWGLTCLFQSFMVLGGPVLVGWISELSNDYRTLFFITTGCLVCTALALFSVAAKNDESDARTGEELLDISNERTSEN